MRLRLFIFITILGIILFNSCSEKIEKKENISKANLKKVDWSDLKGFDNDNLDLAFSVFKKDCKGSKKFKDLKEICQKTEKDKGGEEFFRNNFTPYQLISENKKEEGLITGYYEPLLFGSLTKTDRYQYPIYSVPKNLLIVDFTSVYPELKKYKLRGKLVGNKIIPYDG
jgi:membrane-bound lytic murein transglycosylase A